MAAKKKKASGATIPEAVRAERGTGKVKSFRLGLKAVAFLEAYCAAIGSSQSDVIAQLILALRDDPTILGHAPEGHEATHSPPPAPPRARGARRAYG